MIIKCMNCGGALKFDPVTQKMTCDFCISSFDPETVGFRPDTPVGSKETAATSESTPQNAEATQNYNDMFEEDETDQLRRLKDANASYMDYNIYTCSACGAEVSINSVETATFCVYCGQPTIVLDRIVKDRAPERIIPFSITKERAVQKIHEHFNHLPFTTEEVADCTMDCVRGIYIPYWLINMDYETQTLHRVVHKNDKYSITSYSYNWAKTNLNNLTIDASLQLNNSIARRLDPYDFKGLKPFDVSYLSGYYADCGDVEDKELKSQADARAMALVNEEIRAKVQQNQPSASHISLQDVKFHARFNKMEYVMLPAWFMTYRYENRSYTVLVNGQTGKVVGDAPYSKRVALIYGICFFALYALILSAFFTSSLKNDALLSMILEGAVFLAFGAGGLCIGAHNMLKKYMRTISFFQSDSILDYVSKRQGGDH